MSKKNIIYICSKCDAQFLKWQGRCSECGAWGSISEGQKDILEKKESNVYKKDVQIVNFSEIKGADVKRMKVEIEEVDRVLGGGFVPGSLVLLGGEPGIGKSTLVLQIAERIPKGKKAGICEQGVLYISGEESAEQIKLRIDRLGINPQDIHFLGETNIEAICGAIMQYKPSLAIIDSIQMLYSNEVDSEAGSVNQIRASTAKLMEAAKKSSQEGQNCLAPTIIIIGHITKDGAVAGPKTLEHLVDTVLYLEGERYHTYRLLRTVKNRFGSTNEVGVFEMQSRGLMEVKNPSALFMGTHNENLPGSVVTCIMEGTRPFLIEIQALTTTTYFGYPQRKVSGFDLNRLQLLLAVLQKRLNLNFSNKDVYLNVAGGFKIQEPSADLAVCLALVSALKSKPLSGSTVVFGEVGLGGEIRPVSQVDKRIIEATKLGFKKVICPKSKKANSSKDIIEAEALAEMAELVFGDVGEEE